MDTTGRRQENRYGLTRPGWPSATAHAGVGYICTRLIGACSRASTFEALRGGFHARARPEIPGTSWPAMLRSVLDNPGPGPTHAAAGRGVLLRLLIGGPLSDLLADGALLAEDAARRLEASRFSGNADNPRSHGGATVAPPSKADGKTWEWAALVVTGSNSCASLEGIGGGRRLAEDSGRPGALRAVRRRRA